MKKKILLCICLFLEIFMITGCNKHSASNNDKIDMDDVPIYYGINGTADKIEGKTVIVSIYANDYGTMWNYNEEDNERINNIINNLGIATEYLTKQVKEYGKDAIFLYDWKKYPDLRYETEFTDDILAINGNYELQSEWIVNNIDINKLVNKYEADNIIFIFFFNNKDPQAHSAYTYNKFNIEFTNMFMQEYLGDSPPATYAHEILHTFGAPDLYMENDMINQDYVDYLLENDSDDIMFRVTYTSKIIDNFSSLDAYYVGLIDSNPDIEKWNLGISEHIS